MLRLVSYHTGSVQSSWQAGIECDQSLIGLASYPTHPHVAPQRGTYSSVRAFLAASKAEQEDALAWMSRQLDAGDVVEVAIEGIGSIRNPVVADAHPKVGK